MEIAFQGKNPLPIADLRRPTGRQQAGGHQHDRTEDAPEGGLLPASGFFRSTRSHGRRWLVDPEGCLFIHRGVVSVRENRTEEGRQAKLESYGSPENWAAETVRLLKRNGFNGTGAWTDDVSLQATGDGLVYTRLWNFMSTYGKKRGGTYQKSGHAGYLGDCPFVFDPEFPAFCDEYARQLSATKDDPWLLSHFTDNELPWSRKMLEKHLSLPEKDPGREAAENWLRERHGPGATARNITGEDRQDFLEFAVDRYFSITAAAIRRHDPNHMVLGAGFHGEALKLPEVFHAAGRSVDVVSVNYYRAWRPDPGLLQSWSEESGWLVRTQADRGLFYQNFTLVLLESPVCVGWHWFKYADNDPADRMADPSNRDSNKGIVSNRYREYQELPDSMRKLKTRAYGLIRHFDEGRAAAAP